MKSVVLFVVSVTAPLSYTAALVLKSEDALAPVVQGIALPLLLLSGILLPLALAPDWLRFIASLNPLTHAVDASRALFNGDWGNAEVPRLARVQSGQRLKRGRQGLKHVAAGWPRLPCPYPPPAPISAVPWGVG